MIANKLCKQEIVSLSFINKHRPTHISMNKFLQTISVSSPLSLSVPLSISLCFLSVSILLTILFLSSSCCFVSIFFSYDFSVSGSVLWSSSSSVFVSQFSVHSIIGLSSRISESMCRHKITTTWFFPPLHETQLRRTLARPNFHIAPTDQTVTNSKAEYTTFFLHSD